MELKYKVDTIEVKRAFIIAQLIRKQKIEKPFLGITHLKSKKRLLDRISIEEFKERLKISKEKASSLTEIELDKLINFEYKKRLPAYNSCDWYLGEVNPDEVGVWRRAGGLPLEWTNGSLRETAEKIEFAIKKNSKIITKRTKHTVSNMLATNVHELQNEKYLFPIIFEEGKGTKGRKRLKRKMKGDIDDGCMRSIALTIAGVNKIKAFIGIEKK
jgi:hypothetical protein